MSADSHIALARRAMTKGDAVVAEEQARRAVEIAPLDVEAKYWLARAVHRQGRLAAAAELYGELVDSEEKCRDAAAFFGRCLCELGRIKEAETACDIALAHEPGSMVALFTKAQCLCVRQEYEQADRLFIAATYTQDFVDARIRLFRRSPFQTENTLEHEAIVRSFWENYSVCIGKQRWFDRALSEAQTAPQIGPPETHQPEIWSTHEPSNILPNGHQITLASYASDLFRVGQKNLALSAIRYGGVDHVALWSRADIEKTAFYRQHRVT